jgi:hypothetical protein
VSTLATRDWMRGKAYEVHGQAVPVNVGGTTTDGEPEIVIILAKSDEDPGVPGLYRQDQQVDVWGGDSYTEVDDLVRQITTDLEAVRREAFTEETLCFGASVDSSNDAPDPGASRPRRRLNVAAMFLHHQGD